jgi:D-alanyl-D-alanine carboxypeptidase
MMKKFVFVLMLLIPFKVLGYNCNAKSAILMDNDSHRVLYAKNVHDVQSVASISKVMTAIVSIENKNVNKVVTVGDEIKKAYGSGIYVKEGEKIKLEDLLYGLMMRSGNDAALVIAKNVGGGVDNFVKLMNKEARKIGMTDTVFNNPSGLDEEKGNFSSAYDMALLMSYAMQNDEFKKIVGTKNHIVKTNKNVYKWRNKNKLLFLYPYIVGGKTGFTKIARRTLVTSASKDGLNLTVVTLNDGSDWSDHKNLYEEAFKEYTSYLLLKKGDISIIGENYYKKGFYIKKDIKYPLRKGEEALLKIKYDLLKKRKYKAGDKVGMALVYLGDNEVGHEDIFIKEKGWHLFKHD